MKMYFKTIREINRLNEIILQNLQEEIIYKNHREEIIKINSRFQKRNNLIEVTNKNIFLLTKSNLLVCLDKKNGKVLWSKKIKNQFLSKNQIKFSKKMGSFIDMTIAQNEIFILTKNGYLITFDYKDGSLNYFDKISKSGFSSRMTFSNGYMYILDNNYRLLKYN